MDYGIDYHINRRKYAFKSKHCIIIIKTDFSAIPCIEWKEITRWKCGSVVPGVEYNLLTLKI